MAARNLVTVVPSGEVRTNMAVYLRRFRKQRERAKPVIFGSYRKPEAVILSYARYETLLRALDDLAIRSEVEQRLAAADDADEGTPLAEVMDSLGYDPAEFGLAAPSLR